MRYAVTIAAAAAAMIVLAAPSSATPITQHDRHVIRFFTNHPKQASSPQGTRALWRILGHVTTQLARQPQSATTAAAPSIRHLALWRCIAGYPGARPGGGTGESGGNTAASNGSHFNILQMTDPWAGIHPIGMSATAIMQAAESQYAASGYSHSWLYGQWAQTVSPCMGYA